MPLTYRGQNYNPTAIASEVPQPTTAKFRGVSYIIQARRSSEPHRHPVCLTFLGVPYLKA